MVSRGRRILGRSTNERSPIGYFLAPGLDAVRSVRIRVSCHRVHARRMCILWRRAIQPLHGAGRGKAQQLVFRGVSGSCKVSHFAGPFHAGGWPTKRSSTLGSCAVRFSCERVGRFRWEPSVWMASSTSSENMEGKSSTRPGLWRRPFNLWQLVSLGKQGHQEALIECCSRCNAPGHLANGFQRSHWHSMRVTPASSHVREDDAHQLPTGHQAAVRWHSPSACPATWSQGAFSRGRGWCSCYAPDVPSSSQSHCGSASTRPATRLRPEAQVEAEVRAQKWGYAACNGTKESSKIRSEAASSTPSFLTSSEYSRGKWRVRQLRLSLVLLLVQFSSLSKGWSMVMMTSMYLVIWPVCLKNDRIGSLVSVSNSSDVALMSSMLLVIWSAEERVDWNSVHGGWGGDEKHVTRHLICLPEEGHDRKLIADASFPCVPRQHFFLKSSWCGLVSVSNSPDVALMNSMLLVICSVCLKSDKISWIVPACRKAFVVQQMCWLKFCSWWMGPWWEACYSSSDLSPWRRTRSEADSWCLLPMCTAPAFLSEVLVICSVCLKSDKISWIVPACRKAFVVQQMCWLKFCSWWMGRWWEACYSSSDLSPWRRTRSEADSWCLLPMCTAPAFLSEVFLVLLGFCVEQPWCGPDE